MNRLFTVFLSILAGFAGMSLTAQVALPFPVEVAQAPESSLSLTLKSIHQAKSHLQVNIYQISSPGIASALIKKMQEGTVVEVLAEGQTVQGLSSFEQKVQARIAEVMREVNNGSRYLEMTADKASQRRFRYNHAKYIVVDGRSVLVSSENFNSGGTPQGGDYGNRGWQVLVHDPKTAQRFAALFRQDAREGEADIRVIARSSQNHAPAPVSLSAVPAMAGSLDAKAALQISSPETSSSGLQKLFWGARRTLDIQQMNFDSSFRGSRYNELFTSIVSAARRGVRVRVLLNPDFSGGRVNRSTVDDLNELARKHSLPLEARIADLKRMGVRIIHNKGVIVDGRLTLVSSINWTQTSVHRNRETGVVLQSQQIARYFGNVFDKDWSASD